MDRFILEVPNFLPHKICRELIDIFKNIEDDLPSGNLVYKTTNEDLKKKKPNKEFNLTKSTGIDDINFKLNRYINDLSNLYLNHLEVEFKQNKPPLPHTFVSILGHKKFVTPVGWGMQKIERGSFYEWHVDSQPSQSGCFIQVIIYLNTLEPHENGCTEFANGRKIRPEIGKLVIFPRSWTFPHYGHEVKGEHKFILTTGVDFVI